MNRYKLIRVLYIFDLAIVYYDTNERYMTIPCNMFSTDTSERINSTESTISLPFCLFSFPLSYSKKEIVLFIWVMFACH